MNQCQELEIENQALEDENKKRKKEDQLVLDKAEEFAALSGALGKGVTAAGGRKTNSRVTENMILDGRDYGSIRRSDLTGTIEILDPTVDMELEIEELL